MKTVDRIAISGFLVLWSSCLKAAFSTVFERTRGVIFEEGLHSAAQQPKQTCRVF